MTPAVPPDAAPNRYGRFPPVARKIRVVPLAGIRHRVENRC
jgi:hypothetical protein